ncbi:MAG: polysaccharide biosynthesis tyrosine autokinase [Opitutales bacterium]
MSKSKNNRQSPEIDPYDKAEETALVDLLSPLQLKAFFLIVWDRWLLALTSAVLICTLIGFLMLRQTPVYQSSASLVVQQSPESIVPDITPVTNHNLEGGGQLDVRLQTHIAQIRSGNFLNRLVNSFTEEEKARIQTPYRIEGVWSFQNPFHNVGETGFRSPFLRVEASENEQPSVAGIIHRNMKVERMPGTLLLSITIDHRDPEAATLIANRTAEQYIRHILVSSDTSNDEAIVFLKEQADELQKAMNTAERNTQEYREKHNLVSLEENQNIIVEQLKDLNSSATQARVARLALDSNVNQVASLTEEGESLLELPFISQFGPISEIQRELDQLKSQRDVMSERYGARHPDMRENQLSIDTAQARLDRNIALAVADLRNQQRSAVDQERQLVEELNRAERDALNLDQAAINYNVLTREMERARAEYSRIFQRLGETTIASQIDNINLKLGDAAHPSLEPVTPDLKKVLLILAFLGGMLLISVPLGAEVIDNKLKSWSDVKNLLHHELLGEIPALAKMPPKDRPHVVSRDSETGAVEAFRGLYGQMQLLSDAKFPKSLMITSTIPGEGKSFVACNVASSFANHGKKTLVMDCDFRRPNLHLNYNLNNERGTLKWLEKGSQAPEDLLSDKHLGIRKIKDNLYLLPTGGKTRKTPEMTDDRRFIQLMAALKEEFDVVVVDTPPAKVFPDVLFLAPFCDETVYVCRFGKVNRNLARTFLRKVDDSSPNMLGVILNAMPTNRRGYHYYSGSSFYGDKDYEKYYANEVS